MPNFAVRGGGVLNPLPNGLWQFVSEYEPLLVALHTLYTGNSLGGWVEVLD